MEKECFNGFSKNAKRILNSPVCNSKMQMSHYIAMANLYCPKNNPDGYISLGIAENVISYDLMADKLKVDPNFCQKLTQYSDLGGFKECRQAIANLLENQLFKFKAEKLEHQVNWQQIVIANGATPLLENIFNMFCDEGDVALIPSPLFPNFIPFANQRFGVKVVGVKSEVYNPADNNSIIDFQLDLNEFDRLYNLHPVKLVVICNPNNPTGFIFSDKQIKQLVEWCRNKKVHLLSDEIYALSIFNYNYCSSVGKREDEEDTEMETDDSDDGANFNSVPTNSFSSIYDICKGDMGEYVHLVSSFSKDFAINGFRAGYFYSQNLDVLRYMISTSNYYSCSNLVQSSLINILNDKKYLCNFIKENQKRLFDSYKFAIQTLKLFKIPFIKSSSGLFLTIDLRKCLPKLGNNNQDSTDICPFTKEIQLWELLFENKVIVNPGKLCMFNSPGYFRLIFTLSNDFVFNGIKRISEVYNKLLLS